jgi:hypothetical protein
MYWNLLCSDNKHVCATEHQNNNRVPTWQLQVVAWSETETGYYRKSSEQQTLLISRVSKTMAVTGRGGP